MTQTQSRKKNLFQMNVDLMHGPIFRSLVLFMLPILISNLFQQLYNTVDTMIVGNVLGDTALAAIGSCGAIYELLVGFGLGIGNGLAIVAARAYGAQDEDLLKRTVAGSLVIGLVASLTITTAGFFGLRPLLELLDTPAEILEDAYRYIIIIDLGVIVMFAYNLCAGLLRAIGNSKVPLFFLVFSACLNVVLDLLLILCFHMGVAGAAIATNISQGVSAVLCLIYIYKNVPVLCPERTQWRLSASDTAYQMRMGIPMALQFSITASGAMVMQAAINLFGSVAVAAFTAASKVQNLVTQGMMSMGQTMASYGGQNYGKGDYHRLEKGVRSALLISVIYSLLAAVAVGLFLRPLLSLFFSGDIDMASLMPWAKTYIYMCAVFYIPLSTIFIFRNIMQGCGYSLPMMGGVVELFARMITALIAMKLVSFPLACFCDPAAWVGAALFTGFSWLSVKKKLRASLLPEDTSSSSEAK